MTKPGAMKAPGLEGSLGQAVTVASGKSVHGP